VAATRGHTQNAVKCKSHMQNTKSLNVKSGLKLEQKRDARNVTNDGFIIGVFLLIISL